jgi:hypothetical protein
MEVFLSFRVDKQAPAQVASLTKSFISPFGGLAFSVVDLRFLLHLCFSEMQECGCKARLPLRTNGSASPCALRLRRVTNNFKKSVRYFSEEVT